MGGDTTLVLTCNHPLVQYVESIRTAKISMICQQLYDLGNARHKPLNPEQMTDVRQRSNDIMMLLTK